MEYREFRRHLGKAGVTVQEYASLLHLRPSSISNYAKKGFVPQPHAIIAVALGDAGDHGSSFLSLLARYGVYPDSSVTGGIVSMLEHYRKPQSSRRIE
jgi:hypothetical protein